MAQKTTLAMLESVQAAMEVIETGMQSYSLGERAVAKAQYRDLGAREETLIARLNREGNTTRPRVSQANMSGRIQSNSNWDCS